MRNEISARLSIVRQIRLNSLTTLQSPILHHPPSGYRVSIQSICPTPNRKIRQADLIRISVDYGRHSKEASVDGAVADVKLKVAPVIELRPLQFTVLSDKVVASIVGSFDGDVVAIRAWARDCRAGKFYANTPLPGFGIVVMLIKPDKIASPVGV